MILGDGDWRVRDRTTIFANVLIVGIANTIAKRKLESFQDNKLEEKLAGTLETTIQLNEGS